MWSEVLRPVPFLAQRKKCSFLQKLNWTHDTRIELHWTQDTRIELRIPDVIRLQRWCSSYRVMVLLVSVEDRRELGPDGER